MKNMGRTVSAVVVLLVIIVVAGIFMTGYLKTSSGKLESHIAEIESSARSDNWDKALNGAENVENSWSKTKPLWSVLLDHAEIDNIETAISRMSEYIETQEKPSALAELSALRQFVKHIPRMAAFSIENIF